jgi:FlaA1/EpsC-like NDP-sugar epimerase
MIVNKLPITLDQSFKDSTVLITGAGGTIGSELVNQIQAKTIIAVDISEYAIYKLQRSIGSRNVHCIVGDVSDKKLVNLIFNKYQIDYIFNAAAYKHVDTLEDENNFYSVVKNNILSVINLCDHADQVKSMIHISSDKAVNPTNNMGYTKLWCERIVQQYARTSNTEIKIVRFGNVYKSSGSFLETLEWQIEHDLPITITDPEMKRYFISVQDAVSLIINIVHLEFAKATYILDMGKEHSIMDLVPKGYPQVIIGCRPGEKLREELFYDYEQLQDTSNTLIKKIEWKPVPMITNIVTLLDELKKDKVCLKTLNKIITTTTIL